MEYKPNEMILKEIADEMSKNMSDKEKEEIANIIKVREAMQKTPSYQITITNQDAEVFCNIQTSEAEKTINTMVHAATSLLIGAQRQLNIPMRLIMDAILIKTENLKLDDFEFYNKDE